MLQVDAKSPNHLQAPAVIQARARGRDAMAMHDLSQGIGELRISTEITVNVNTREADAPARSSSSTTQDGTTRLRASTTRVGSKAIVQQSLSLSRAMEGPPLSHQDWRFGAKRGFARHPEEQTNGKWICWMLGGW